MAAGSDKKPFIVVLAVDPSENSEFSFKYYLNHVHRPGNQLHIVHVPENNASKANEQSETSKNMTEKLMENYLQWCSQHGIPDAKFAHPQGSESWHEIVKYTEKVGAGLIVVGSRGQSKLRRTFMGSVSDSVLHHASVPVLVCKTKEETAVPYSH